MKQYAAAYGYLRGTVTTTLDLLEHESPEEAMRVLRDGLLLSQRLLNDEDGDEA